MGTDSVSASEEGAMWPSTPNRPQPGRGLVKTCKTLREATFFGISGVHFLTVTHWSRCSAFLPFLNFDLIWWESFGIGRLGLALVRRRTVGDACCVAGGCVVPLHRRSKGHLAGLFAGSVDVQMSFSEFL